MGEVETDFTSGLAVIANLGGPALPATSVIRRKREEIADNTQNLAIMFIILGEDEAWEL
jgi:hypothetical protein